MNDPVSDLPFEAITENILRLKQAQAIQTAPVPSEYLESMQSVNDALRQGAHITIRVHHHSFTCPPGGIPVHPGGVSSSYPPSNSCLLILNKVIVTFTQLAQSHLSSISLRFWDDTHGRSVIWGATTVQPQWDAIVQQAASFQATHASTQE